MIEMWLVGIEEVDGGTAGGGAIRPHDAIKVGVAEAASRSSETFSRLLCLRERQGDHQNSSST